MADRELLEMAAKAAGVKWLPSTTEKGIELENKFGLWLVIDGEPSECQRRRWNPLIDDGDALRLAVMLKMIIDTKQGGGWPVCASADGVPWIEEHPCGDPGSATRRAIVRAAAEIGKAM